MPIQSQNAVLNQYVPPFCVDSPVAGETLVYDATYKTWKNKVLTASDLGNIAPNSLLWQSGYGPGDVVTISEDLSTFVATPRSEFGNGPGGGATKLNDLSDVRILTPFEGQAFIFDAELQQWVNGFADYNSLSNIPTEFTPEEHDHVKADITDFVETDYATESQGLLADTSLQPGSMISELVNDTGYLLPGANISDLVNDAGYLLNITNESIGDLNDVDLSNNIVGASLTWTGTGFILSEHTFSSNADTPETYVGQAGKILAVNTAEDAIEYIDSIDGGAY